MPRHAVFSCREDVAGVKIVTIITQKPANDGVPAHVLLTDTLASIFTKNVRRATSHATQPLAHAVKALDLRQDLRGPLKDLQDAKVHKNHLLDPEHRAAHVNQVEMRSVKGAPNEQILLTQRKRKRKSAKSTAKNANPDRKLMPYLCEVPDHNTGGMLVEPSFKLWLQQQHSAVALSPLW